MTIMNKTALVPIAEGVEEIEVTCIIDVLRRAKVAVTVASVDGITVTASRGVSLNADTLLTDVIDQEYDLIALPGGMGAAQAFRDCEILIEKLKKQAAAGKLYAAICATPELALNTHGLIGDKKATCHPGVAAGLADNPAINERVVVDGNLTTSRGPGTAIEFALALVGQLCGQTIADEIAKAILV